MKPGSGSKTRFQKNFMGNSRDTESKIEAEGHCRLLFALPRRGQQAGRLARRPYRECLPPVFVGADEERDAGDREGAADDGHGQESTRTAV